MLKQFIGDRFFYKSVFAMAIPIIIQNSITTFVSLLDNIMVGQVGTLPMSGVAIVNQFLFIFNLCIFGAVSGAGIYIAQFYGKQDQEGIRHSFRFKLLASLLVSILGIALFCLTGPQLILSFMQGDDDPVSIQATLEYGLVYLQYMLPGLIPFALATAYSTTLRETEQTVVPMVAGVCAVMTNLVLNYILIFGHFGFEAMGVKGAALATSISRYVELVIVAGWTHLHPDKNPFIRSIYRSFRIPGKLLGSITVKTIPLMLNEGLWASGVAFLNQCYSTRGLDVVAAMNISSTLVNLTSVVYLAIGNVVGIVMGKMLGSGKSEQELRSTNKKMIALSIFFCIVFGLITISVSTLFPLFYDTTAHIRTLATALICIYATTLPLNGFNHASYFTLRSGGKTLITFLFDSGSIWAVSAPLAYCLSRFTSLPILPMYAICLWINLLKCLFGYYMVKKGSWIQNLAQKE